MKKRFQDTPAADRFPTFLSIPTNPGFRAFGEIPLGFPA
jgi:hypothetical protein